MRTYATEFLILPALGMPYFYSVGEFTLPGALFNNAILTAVCGVGALWKSKGIAKQIGRRNHHRLEPVWPAFMGLILIFLAALQLVLSITHVSYYRKGPLVTDMFDA